MKKHVFSTQMKQVSKSAQEAIKGGRQVGVPALDEFTEDNKKKKKD